MYKLFGKWFVAQCPVVFSRSCAHFCCIRCSHSVITNNVADTKYFLYSTTNTYRRPPSQRDRHPFAFQLVLSGFFGEIRQCTVSRAIYFASFTHPSYRFIFFIIPFHINLILLVSLSLSLHHYSRYLLLIFPRSLRTKGKTPRQLQNRISDFQRGYSIIFFFSNVFLLLLSSLRVCSFKSNLVSVINIQFYAFDEFHNNALTHLLSLLRIF